MNRFRQLGISMVAVSMLALCVFASSAAAATTKSVSIKCNGKLASPTKIEGTCTGSLGKATFVTNSSPPSYVQTMKFAGGTLVLKGEFKPTPEGTYAGNWKISKGTGKFKGATGTGKTVAGSGVSTLTGTIKY